MTFKLYKKFIKSLCTLSPDVYGNPAKSLTVLKTHGLDGYIRRADSNTAELAELAELLILLEKRGV